MSESPESPSSARVALPRISRDFFGPVFRWEMMTLPRRLRYTLLRILYAVLLFVVFWLTYANTFHSGYQQSPISAASRFSSELFLGLAFSQIGAVMLLTPAFIAGTIAQEKERKTIDYLFASDLSNREIIFGKLLPRCANMIFILLVAIPIVALSGLFGGIDYVHLLYANVSLFAVILSTAGLSLVVSLACRTSRQALLNAYLVNAVLFFSPIVIVVFGFTFGSIAEALWGSAVVNAFFDKYLFNPTMEAIGFGLLGAHPMAVPIFLSEPPPPGVAWMLSNAVYISVGVHLSVAALCVAWCMFRLRRAADTSPPVEATSRKRWRWRLPRLRWPRTKMWENHPLAWREIHGGTTGLLGRLATIIVTVAVVLFYVYFAFLVSGLSNDSWLWGRKSDQIRGILAVGCIVISAYVYLQVALRASTSISEERDRDCWISLLSGPFSRWQIVVAKFLGALQPLRLYVVCVLPAFLMAWGNGAIGPGHIALSIGFAFAFATGLAALGVYLSLCAPNGGIAMTVTLFTGGATFGGLQFLMAVLTPHHGSSDEAPLVGSVPPFVVGLVMRWKDKDILIELMVQYAFIFAALHMAAAAAILYRTVVVFPKVTGRIE